MRNNPIPIKPYGRVGFLALVCVLGAAPVRAHAQDVPAAQLDSLRAELEILRARLDSLADIVGRGQAEPEVRDLEETTTDAIARLRAAAEAAVGDAAADTVAQGT